MHKTRKQSQTAHPLFFYMVDSADHISGKTGLSPTVVLSKDGAAFGAPSGAVSEIANGWYQVAGNATDSATLGELLLHATSAGADPSDTSYTIIAADPFDAKFGVAYPTNFSSMSIDSNGRVKGLVGWTKNVGRLITFVMNDSTTHLPKTGLVNGTFTSKTVSLDGAAASTLGGTITEVDSTNWPGLYTVTLANGEVNGNDCAYHFAATGCDDTDFSVSTSA